MPRPTNALRNIYTKDLKNAGENFKTIYVKKDLHSSVRAEWKRLRDAEEKEKQRPENAGCEIRFDAREKKLYRDNVVIDTWRPKVFPVRPQKNQELKNNYIMNHLWMQDKIREDTSSMSTASMTSSA